jgi:hypothetical protein
MKTRTNISFPHHKKIYQIGIASGFALGCLPSSVAAVQTPGHLAHRSTGRVASIARLRSTDGAVGRRPTLRPLPTRRA